MEKPSKEKKKVINPMEILKKIRKKDIKVNVEANAKIFARQDVTSGKTKPVGPEAPRYGSDTTTKYETSPKEDPKKGQSKVTRGRKSSKKIRGAIAGPYHTFKKKGDKLLLPIGGPFGIVDRALSTIVDKMGRSGSKYVPVLHLIDILPEQQEIDGNAEIKEEVILVTRNTTRRRTTMVPETFQYIEDIPLEFQVVFNSACLLDIEELMTLLHGLETCKFGPTRRGRCRITDVTIQ